MEKLIIILAVACLIIIIIQIKKRQAFQGNRYADNKMPVTPDSPETCKDPNDPEEVCNNFETCCQEGLEYKNCLCSNPVILTCMEDYEKCLQGNMFNEKSLQYIGKPKIKPTCNTVKNKCCKLINKLKSNDEYTKTSMIKGEPANKLCLVSDTDDTEAKLCKNLCSLNDKCNFVIHNSSAGECNLYSGTPLPKSDIVKQSDSDYFSSYVKSNGNTEEDTLNEDNNNNTENFIDYSNFCMDYESECGLLNQNKDNCLCSHGIIQNCLENKNKCLKNKIENISSSIQQQMCNNTFGSCCDVIKNIEVSDKFVFGEPVAGSGILENMLCNSKETPLKFVECSNSCLNNPNCDYFETNIITAPDFEPNSPRYCRHYSGEPKLTPPEFSSGPPGIGGSPIIVPKTIYKKSSKY